MNKKIFVLVFTLFLVSTFSFAEKMALSPIIVYDRDSSKIECDTDFEEIFYKSLEQEWFSGLISFVKLNASDFGDIYTVLDANKACSAGNFAFILYGFIQKNENSWYGNLKLYSASAKKIEKEFFAGDDISNLQRFISVLTQNLISGIYEITGLAASGQKSSDVVPFRINIPMEVFYWNPLGEKWNKVYTGIAGGTLGIDFIPPQKKLIISKHLIYFSLGMDFSYSFAIGKENSYSLNLHSVQVLTPVLFHVDFNENHSVFIKAAPYYEMEFLDVVEKYEEEEFHFQNMAGVQVGFGYEFTAAKFLKFYAKTDFDFHFSKDNFCDVKVGLGAKFMIYNGRV